MLINAADAEAIEAGEITVIVRKWKRPQAKVGGVYRTMRGWLRVTSVEVRPFGSVDDAVLAAAGPMGRDELTERFGIAPDDDVHVLVIERCDDPERPDPGADAVVDDDEFAALLAKLDRLDERSPTGPWTRATLGHIAGQPGTRSADMAVDLDRVQAELKADVRKLKRLGLTRSLERGYELSPRGRTVVDRLG